MSFEVKTPLTPVAPGAALNGVLNGAAGSIDPSRIPQSIPQHTPPFDPLTGATKKDTQIVYADQPLTETIIDWNVDQIRSALWSHNYGVFFQSGLLTDAIMGDPRVQATLGSLNAALFGHEVIFTPANDSFAAKEVCDAWQSCWPRLANTSTFTQLGATSKMMGFSPCQVVWDTTKPIWAPELRPWHTAFTYYHWWARRYVALSQDGPIAIQPGNGKWLVHFPYGDYRGWIRGAVRAVAEPWLLRHQSFRDHGRYNEVHGVPIKKAIVPAASDQIQRDAYAEALNNIGRQTTIMVSRGVDGNNGYDLELVEPQDQAYLSFPCLVDRCDMDIVLAILFQNMSTEIKGGAFAAVDAHMDVLQQAAVYDNLANAWTVYSQLARPFAWLNFGDPDLAPMTRWDVTPRGQYVANADQFAKFGTAIEVLARGGIKFSDSAQVKEFAAREFGIKRLPDFTIGDPPVGSKGGSGGGGGGFSMRGMDPIRMAQLWSQFKARR